MKRLFIFLLLSLNARFAFGYITSDVTGGCFTTDTDLFGVFTPFKYTCGAGYFLPADTLGCVACPSGYTCNGGTYSFNDTIAQGITQKNFITETTNNTCSVNFTHADNDNYSELVATFTINEYNCSPGYYLPAGNDWLTDNDGCTICPENSYCVGGTYTFSENVAQGITACAAGTYSPAGMWEVAQCGRIFHVGDDVVYLRAVRKTEHALNFDIDMDGVADYFANMTPLSVPMHINAAHGLKILLDGIEYSVYDDTVDLGLYENNPFVPAQ